MRRKSESVAITIPHVRGADDIGGLQDIVGFHLRLAHGAVYRHFMETFASLDLTQKQVSVMWLISDHPGIAQTNLADLMRMDRATTMAIVDRLSDRDLLRREPSKTDRRKQALYLTPVGKSRLSQARKAISIHEDWLKSRFSPAEIVTLVGLLTRIHE
jgi:DNA-binding MarR family transcriptional regulator